MLNIKLYGFSARIQPPGDRNHLTLQSLQMVFNGKAFSDYKLVDWVVFTGLCVFGLHEFRIKP